MNDSEKSPMFFTTVWLHVVPCWWNTKSSNTRGEQQKHQVQSDHVTEAAVLVQPHGTTDRAKERQNISTGKKERFKITHFNRTSFYIVERSSVPEAYR